PGSRSSLDRCSSIDGSGLDPIPVAVGFLGYDLGRAIERLPSKAADDLPIPDLWFGRYPAVWRFDRLSGQGAVLGCDEKAMRRLHAALCRRQPRSAVAPLVVGPLAGEHPVAGYLDSVAAIRDYIEAGDVYQVNLARRLRANVLATGDPLPLYQRLANGAPAPFGAVLECDDLVVISNSPELFLRRPAYSERVETRPIKGTRARGRNPESDSALVTELVRDEKELAEHLMIVDLERNDLGRIARPGSVAVESFARVVSLPAVHHLVSTVSCQVRDGTSAAELLAATFPGGSITGAPKVRAMEIIDELEPVRRKVYTGAIGYLGVGGAVDLAITIRTAVVVGGSLFLQVGGGIVADSQPLRELEETEEKAASWVRLLS
ncbi:MAG: anthranilate synthase component I family protein, partial [Pseudomonadota bacterium]